MSMMKWALSRSMAKNIFAKIIRECIGGEKRWDSTFPNKGFSLSRIYRKDRRGADGPVLLLCCNQLI